MQVALSVAHPQSFQTTDKTIYYIYYLNFKLLFKFKVPLDFYTFLTGIQHFLINISIINAAMYKININNCMYILF
jgi:hypothetical protein